MKKLFSILAMALPLAAAAQVGDAMAQRANHTKKDVPVAYTDASDNTVRNSDEAYKNAKYHDKKLHKKHHDENKGGFDKKEHKKHKEKMKDGKHPGHMFGEDREEIEEKYSKAMRSIEKSSFSQRQKEMLVTQAKENRDLALRQIEERTSLVKEHMKEFNASEEFKNEVKADEANKKAVKKIGKILD